MSALLEIGLPRNGITRLFEVGGLSRRKSNVCDADSGSEPCPTETRLRTGSLCEQGPGRGGWLAGVGRSSHPQASCHKPCFVNSSKRKEQGYEGTKDISRIRLELQVNEGSGSVPECCNIQLCSVKSQKDKYTPWFNRSNLLGTEGDISSLQTCNTLTVNFFFLKAFVP
jgi:hypothetical protein